MKQPGVVIPLGDLFGGSSDLAALMGDARLQLSAIGLSLANPLGFHLAGAVLGAWRKRERTVRRNKT